MTISKKQLIIRVKIASDKTETETKQINCTSLELIWDKSKIRLGNNKTKKNKKQQS